MTEEPETMNQLLARTLPGLVGKTIKSPTVAAQVNAPAITSIKGASSEQLERLVAALHTLSEDVYWSRKPVESKGTIFALFRDPKQEAALRTMLRILMIMSKDRTSFVYDPMHRKSYTASHYHNQDQTYQEILGGILADKVTGGGDFSNPQFKEINKILGVLGLDKITFHKVK